MSLFDKLFPKQAVGAVTGNYLQTLTGYRPIFHTFNAGMYESELCRACIHSFATHASKLKPVVSGARKDLQGILEYQPNPWMDTTKFLYKIATVLETENTVLLIPLYDKYYQKIVGVYPIQPSQAEIREINGKTYVAFNFVNGQRASMWFDQVGIMNKFFYKNEFFGENNAALQNTLNLIYTQQQGISEGIKQSATVRFLGQLAMSLKPEQIEEERKRWVRDNLDVNNTNGIALYDTKYNKIERIESKPYTVDAEQLKAIKDNAFEYFGTNEKILKNAFTPEEWAAYYEAKIEPFALQLSLVLTNMLYTQEQRNRKNSIQFTSNRLQYASTAEKLNVVQQLLDRGTLSRNEAREIFNLEPIDGGDAYIIRGEYYEAGAKLNEGADDGQL